MSMLGWANFLFFQWFFVRLAQVFWGDGRPTTYKWLIGIIPLTGWWSDYKYINK